MAGQGGEELGRVTLMPVLLSGTMGDKVKSRLAYGPAGNTLGR